MAINDKHDDDKTTAHKLHLQFGHPTPEALIHLIKQARLQTKGLLKEVHAVSNRCVIRGGSVLRRPQSSVLSA